MRSKRGSMEVQFNWIFVLVAGGLIVILFTSFVLQQKESSDTAQDFRLSSRFDTILAASFANTDSTQQIRIPQAELRFQCDILSVGSVPRPVTTIFGPSNLDANQLIIANRQFDMPFTVTNILYMTSPDVRYIFIGSPSAIAAVEPLMPNGTFVESGISASNFDPRGEDRVRFVFVDTAVGNLPASFNRMERQDISALRITTASREIEFFQADSSGFRSEQVSHYLDESTLLGALIADSSEHYHCIFANLMDKTRLLVAIHQDKMTRIVDEYVQSGDVCASNAATVYNPNSLNQIGAAALAVIQEARGPSGTVNDLRVQTLLGNAQQVQSNNDRAQRLSCAMIY